MANFSASDSAPTKSSRSLDVGMTVGKSRIDAIGLPGKPVGQKQANAWNLYDMFGYHRVF
jgi:hypothetical protein